MSGEQGEPGPPAAGGAIGDKKFKDTLWSSFEETYNRVTKGRHDLKNVHEYLLARAKLEEHYAKELQKLTQRHEFETKGTLNGLWTSLIESDKSQGERHKELAQTFKTEIGKDVEACVDRMKKEKTRIHKDWSKLHSARESWAAKHTKALERYRKAVQSAETAVINRDNGVKENFADKKLKQLQSVVDSSLKEVVKSHDDYKKTVDHLKETQQQYDASMLIHLAEFEGLEREREQFVHSTFTKMQQCTASLKTSLEQGMELVAQALKTVDVDRDIQMFIAEHEAKEDPPPHVEYVPIKSAIIDHAMGNKAPGSDFVAPPSPVKSASGARGGSSAAPPSAAAPAAAAAAAPAASAAASASSAAAAPASSTGTDGLFAKALYDFDSQEPNDLPFKAGDRIKIINQDDDNWWTGELKGRTGNFPVNYVEVDAKPVLVTGKCKALFDFVAQSNDELSFSAGDMLEVTGELNGWFLGKSADGKNVGIFPANYVEMLK